jgi:hypothetical protein
MVVMQYAQRTVFIVAAVAKSYYPGDGDDDGVCLQRVVR